MSKESIKQTAKNILEVEGKLSAAEYLARTLFDGRTDKAGAPYIGHLQRVAGGVADPAIKPAAWLHDLIEDIPGWGYDDLRDIGFEDFEIDAIRAVTKISDDEPYFEAIMRVGRTQQAIPIKRSDLYDNSDLRRLNRLPTEKDIERVRKYCLARQYLADIESGKIQPGADFRTWMASQPAQMQDAALLEKETAPAGAKHAPRGPSFGKTI